MSKIILLISAFIISSCILNQNKSQRDETKVPETWEQKKDREARAQQTRDLQRNSLGYFQDERLVSRQSVGSENGFFALGSETHEYTHRFFIKTVCGDSAQFTAQPLRYANFTWMLSESLKGNSQSDHDGIIEIALTTPRSVDFKKVQLSFKGQSFDVASAPANMILSIPQKLCKTN